MDGITIFTSFAAGLISFLSPCVLPLVPGYISVISGFTLDQLKVESGKASLQRAGPAEFGDVHRRVLNHVYHARRFRDLDWRDPAVQGGYTCPACWTRHYRFRTAFTGCLQDQVPLSGQAIPQYRKTTWNGRGLRAGFGFRVWLDALYWSDPGRRSCDCQHQRNCH